MRSLASAYLEPVKLAAENGKALFCEKPIGRNLKEAEEIYNICKKSNTVNQIGLILRFSPIYREIKWRLDSEEGGTPISCIFRDDQFFPTGNTYGSAWREDPSQTGGGCLIEHSIHDIDIMIWFFGKIKSIFAKTADSKVAGIEKLACVNIEFKNGLIAQLQSIWHSIYSRENNRNIEIFCENAYCRTEGEYNDSLSIQRGQEDIEIISKERVNRNFLKREYPEVKEESDFFLGTGLELYEFFNSILSKKRIEVDMETGMEVHRAIESAYNSAKQNKPVLYDHLV